MKQEDDAFVKFERVLPKILFNDNNNSNLI